MASYFLVAILKSQRDLSEKLKRKREQRMKKLEMEQAAEKEDFERKVSTCTVWRLCEIFCIISHLLVLRSKS